MHFIAKNTLKSNRYHTLKHVLNRNRLFRGCAMLIVNKTLKEVHFQ